MQPQTAAVLALRAAMRVTHSAGSATRCSLLRTDISPRNAEYVHATATSGAVDERSKPWDAPKDVEVSPALFAAPTDSESAEPESDEPESEDENKKDDREMVRTHFH